MLERLQKLIAQAGIASRRRAEELIKAGEVTVNGEIVTELGTKADPEIDHIKVGGKLINQKLKKRENVYILLNKPKGYLSSAADPEGRKLVTDLVRGYGKLHPVGRLDYNTEGLLILTNDGEFTNLVASSKKVPKVYEVKVKGLPNENAINKLRRGIVLEDGFKTAPAEIKPLKSTEHNAWFEVTLYEGHNQQIRKMFDAVGHSVVKLRRTAIGHVKDQHIPVGAYRELDEQEVRGFFNPSDKFAKKVESNPNPTVPPRKQNSRNESRDKSRQSAHSRTSRGKKRG
jgi:23S rRNA pseudouridine2605 synthase